MTLGNDFAISSFRVWTGLETRPTCGTSFVEHANIGGIFRFDLVVSDFEGFSGLNDDIR